MRPAPLPRVMPILPALALALVVAACGGNNASSSSGGSGSSAAASSGSGSGSSSAASAQASTGSGGGTSDLGPIVDALVPPNSSQTVRTDAADAVFVSYASTDSQDSLKSFYENAIKNAGMTIVSTTSTGDAVSWIFTKDGDSSFGGSVTVGPGANGTGSQVTITLGKS